MTSSEGRRLGLYARRLVADILELFDFEAADLEEDPRSEEAVLIAKHLLLAFSHKPRRKPASRRRSSRSSASQ